MISRKNVCRGLLCMLLGASAMKADSFFMLKGVKDYSPLIVNNIPKTKQYNETLKKMMVEASKELGIHTPKHLSRVLVFVLRRFSVGETVAIELDLELGEYVKREGVSAPIFALTYKDTRMFEAEELEEDIMDNAESLLEKFAANYHDDNRITKTQKSSQTHAGFAKAMGYESVYGVALKKAKKEHKPLLVFMTTNYCPWCRKLEKNVLSQGAVASKIAKDFVPLMLNLELEDFPASLGKIKLTPTLYVVDENNASIKAQFIGYSARDDFKHFLKTYHRQ